MILKRLVRKFLNRFGIEVVRSNSNYFRAVSLYRDLLKASYSKSSNEKIDCIIFSMDRAMQLHALLRSMMLNCAGCEKICVIFRASTEAHRLAYLDIQTLFGGKIQFQDESEKGFRKSLIDTLNQSDSENLFFLVDDIVFIRPIDLGDLSMIDFSKVIFSLRLGSQLTYSYVVHRNQKLPNLSKFGKYLAWNWDLEELDWAYPLSVDGHIFRRCEILPLVEFYDFKSPNTLESVIQYERDIFSKKLGACCEQSVLVNNPCNIVQTDFKNRHGSLHQDELLHKWIEGMEIDIDEFQGRLNRSVHEEFEFSFTERR